MTGLTRRLKARHLLILPGLAVAMFAGTEAERHGIGIAPLLLFGIVPDLPRLLGIGQAHEHGQLAPRAVPLFNALHHPVPPLALLGLAALDLLPAFWLAGAIAWLGHIVMGLGVGDRLRTRDGFLRSHWLVDAPRAGRAGRALPRGSRAVEVRS